VSADSGTPAGTVKFYDGTTLLGSATLDSTAHASLRYSFFGTGPHAITAVYAGSTTLQSSTSAPLTLTVTAGADVAGTAVLSQVRVTSGNYVLVVNGTDGADNIVVSQSNGSFVVQSGSGTQSFSAPSGAAITGIVVNGYGGDDTIQLDGTVTSAVTATLNGGGGNNNLINNGKDVATLNAGAGSDTLISTGGAADKLNGGAGTDSFWFTSNATVSNVNAGEQAIKSVHKITTYAGNLVEPAADAEKMQSSNYTYSNAFANRPLFAGTPQYNDILQGYLGDCYFLSSLASMAQTNPAWIQQSIVGLGDGTYAVRFLKTDGSETYYRIDAQLPVYGGNLIYGQLTRNGQALWVPLLEKAFAEFPYGKNSYASIEGGWMYEGYAAITGSSYTALGTTGDGAALAQMIASNLSSGHAVTAASYWNSGGMIVASHAYMVKAVDYDTSTGTWYITVYNPWGVDGRSYDSNYGDGLLRLSVADFEAHFVQVQVSTITSSTGTHS
jgi:hypothetical protein